MMDRARARGVTRRGVTLRITWFVTMALLGFWAQGATTTYAVYLFILAALTVGSAFVGRWNFGDDTRMISRREHVDA